MESSRSAAACICSSASSSWPRTCASHAETTSRRTRTWRVNSCSPARAAACSSSARRSASPSRPRCAAETPREPGHGFRPGEAVPLESIVRSWLEIRCLRPGAAPPTNQWQFLVDSERRSVDIRPRIRADCARPVLSLWGSRATAIGLCLLPTAREDIAAGRLLRLLEARSLQSLGWCGVPAEPTPAGQAARVFDHLVGHSEPGPDR